MVEKQKITAQAMRQDVLNRLDASRKAIAEISDDELESIAGGGKGPDVQLPLRSTFVGLIQLSPPLKAQLWEMSRQHNKV